MRSLFFQKLSKNVKLDTYSNTFCWRCHTPKWGYNPLWSVRVWCNFIALESIEHSCWYFLIRFCRYFLLKKIYAICKSKELNQHVKLLWLESVIRMGNEDFKKEWWFPRIIEDFKVTLLFSFLVILTRRVFLEVFDVNIWRWTQKSSV